MHAYPGVGACPGYYSSSTNYRTASKNLALLIYYLAPFTESLKIIFSEKGRRAYVLQMGIPYGEKILREKTITDR